MSGKVVLKKKKRPLTGSQTGPQIDEIIVTCPGGAEDTLLNELTGLGIKGLRREGAAVRGAATAGDVPRLNAEIRTGSRVLVPVARFPASDFDTVYREARGISWERYLGVDDTFMIDAASHSEVLRDHRFLAMRLKDAIVDRQRELSEGRRSSVDKERPNLIVHIIALDDSVEIAIDSTGIPLNRRGYRLEAGDAPIRETVAAMLLLDAGYRRGDSRVLLDPFCGSGTIVIEAALIFAGRGPGTLGREFAWQRWPWLGRGGAVRGGDGGNTGDGGAREVDRSAAPRIVGADIDPVSIEMAWRNAERAGVSELVHFEVAGFRASVPRWTSSRPTRDGGNNRDGSDDRDGGAGLIVTNPPYGVRLQSNDLSALYSDLGTVLRSARGWSATILAAEEAPARRIGLTPLERRRVYNGAIPCRANRFEIYNRARTKNERDR